VRTRIVVALALALSLVGSATAGASRLDPCGLVTNAQVSKAIGYKVQERAAGGNRMAPSCKWSGTPIGFLQTRPSLMIMARRMTESQFTKGSGGAGTPIVGLGGPGYEALNGAFVVAWRHGVALTFDFTQTQATPKTTLVLVSTALANA
jgi:hypothetical protein